MHYEQYAMSNTHENGPGQDHREPQGSDSGDQPDIQPASDEGSDRGGTTGGMGTMFDRLRDAAAEHDGDCDLLPLIQDGAATGQTARALTGQVRQQVLVRYSDRNFKSGPVKCWQLGQCALQGERRCMKMVMQP